VLRLERLLRREESRGVEEIMDGVIIDSVAMMEVMEGVGVIWEDLATQHNKEDFQEVMEEPQVVMGTQGPRGAWGVPAMVVDKALVIVDLGLTVDMERQGAITEVIREVIGGAILHLLEEVTGVIVAKGTRIEGIKMRLRLFYDVVVEHFESELLVCELAMYCELTIKMLIIVSANV